MNEYNNKRVLITGGLGFIGSNLARSLLNCGANVTLIDNLIPEYGGNFSNISDIRDDVEVNISDIRDPYIIKHLIDGVDYLFNLAAQTSHVGSMDDPLTDLDINARAQLSLLETCKAINRDIKVIFASTRQIYGKPDYLPVNESHPNRPVDINGVNKLAGETFHTLYNDIYGIRTATLRLTNCYGPGMRVKDARQTFVGIWVRNLIENKPILVYGDGKQLRDFNYVDDCVSALMLAGSTDKSNGKVYNLGSTEVVSLIDLAEMISNLHPNIKGSYKLVQFPDDRKAIDIGDYYGDFTKIKNDLGWTPAHGLREGLSKTLEYYALRINEYT